MLPFLLLITFFLLLLQKGEKAREKKVVSLNDFTCFIYMRQFQCKLLIQDQNKNNRTSRARFMCASERASDIFRFVAIRFAHLSMVFNVFGLCLLH